jgi:hypothetical protein
MDLKFYLYVIETSDWKYNSSNKLPVETHASLRQIFFGSISDKYLISSLHVPSLQLTIQEYNKLHTTDITKLDS